VPVSEDRQAQPARRLLAGALGQEDERPMRRCSELTPCSRRATWHEGGLWSTGG